MHAAFLYHAIRAGLDMGIVNAGQLAVYEDITPELLERVEDVIFNRRPDATERLVEIADRCAARGRSASSTLVARSDRREAARARARPRDRRLHRGRHRGGAAGAAAAARRDRGAADGRHARRRRPLRLRADVPAAGRQVRARDEARGRVPRAVHGGRAATAGAAQGKVVLATVKGDVHDIGKNIVGVVLGCNNYEVIDLGVMVPADRILDTAASEGADVVGLSGLITPSLDQMVDVAREMERRGLELPLLIGGATTSRQHTAVKIAPAYAQRDRARARRAPRRRRRLRPARPEAARASSTREPRAPGAAARPARREGRGKPLLPLARARGQPRAPSRSTTCRRRRSRARARSSRRSRSSSPYIDWQFFFHAWDLKGKFPAILDDPAARELYDDAQRAAATRSLAGRVAPPAGRLRLLAGARRRATTSSSRRRRASASCASRPITATGVRTAASPTTSRRPATTSARSPSRSTAPTSSRRATRRSTTTTARSWSRHSPTGSPRRSPSGCTSARGASGTRPTSSSRGGPHQGELPRHPAGIRLPGVPGPQREAEAVRAARRGAGRDRADRDVRDARRPRRVSGIYFHHPQARYFAVGPDRPRPGGGLRDAARGSRSPRPSAGSPNSYEPDAPSRLRARLGYPGAAGARGRRLSFRMRTTLKRGVGRGAGSERERPAPSSRPATVSAVTRYRQPPPPAASGFGDLPADPARDGWSCSRR